jgi:hypothetical protein
MGFQATAYEGFASAPEPVAFGLDHLDQLPPSPDKTGQSGTLMIRHLALCGPNRFREPGDHLAVEPVCLRQATDGSGIVSDLSRVDDSDVEARLCQQVGNVLFQAACWIQDDQGDIARAKTADQLPDTRAIVRQREAFLAGERMNIPTAGADIDAEITG